MSTPTFYVLHGDDEFSLKALIHKMQTDLNDPAGLNMATLDGSSAMHAINAVSAVPFLADKRLVIVEGMLDKAPKAELETLAEELPHLPDFARLVFRENKTLSEKNAILQLARNHERGYEKNFSIPADLSQWIIRQAKSVYNLEFTPIAAAALASVINKDLRAADSEIVKLGAFVDFARPITEKDVAALTPYVAEADIFEMVDAIGQRDGQKAMRLTQNLLSQGNDPLSLFGMINRQFRLLILAKEYLNENGTPAGMGKAIGVHDFVASKKLAPQAGRFREIKSLESIYKKLVEYDYSIKMGKLEAEMALQLFIAGITGNAN